MGGARPIGSEWLEQDQLVVSGWSKTNWLLVGGARQSGRCRGQFSCDG